MAQRPIAQKGDVCPLHRTDVSKVCHRCPLYTQLRGADPQTGKDVDQWMCALASLPMLLVGVMQKEDQTGTAVESFRNEVVKGNEDFSRTLAAVAGPPLLKR